MTETCRTGQCGRQRRHQARSTPSTRTAFPLVLKSPADVCSTILGMSSSCCFDSSSHLSTTRFELAKRWLENIPRVLLSLELTDRQLMLLERSCQAMNRPGMAIAMIEMLRTFCSIKHCLWTRNPSFGPSSWCCKAWRYEVQDRANSSCPIDEKNLTKL